MANETTEKDLLLKLFQNYIRRTTRKYVDKEGENESRTKKDYKSHLNRFPFDTIKKILLDENDKKGWRVQKSDNKIKKNSESKTGEEP